MPSKSVIFHGKKKMLFPFVTNFSWGRRGDVTHLESKNIVLNLSAPYVSYTNKTGGFFFCFCFLKISLP